MVTVIPTPLPQPHDLNAHSSHGHLSVTPTLLPQPHHLTAHSSLDHLCAVPQPLCHVQQAAGIVPPPVFNPQLMAWDLQGPAEPRTLPVHLGSARTQEKLHAEFGAQSRAGFTHGGRVCPAPVFVWDPLRGTSPSTLEPRPWGDLHSSTTCLSRPRMHLCDLKRPSQ